MGSMLYVILFSLILIYKLVYQSIPGGNGSNGSTAVD